MINEEERSFYSKGIVSEVILQAKASVPWNRQFKSARAAETRL